MPGNEAYVQKVLSPQEAKRIGKLTAKRSARSRLRRSLPLFAHRWLCGFGGRAVLAVVDNLPNREFMLSERIERCGSALACADGSLYPVCAAYRMGKERKR